METKETVIERMKGELAGCLDATGIWDPIKKVARADIIRAYTDPVRGMLPGLDADVLAQMLIDVRKEWKPDTRPQTPAPTFNPKPTEELARLLGWTKKVSDIPGYFPNRMPGQRCLWSVRWVTPLGRGFKHLTPIDLALDPELMPVEWIKVELEDVADRVNRQAANLLTGLPHNRAHVTQFFSTQRERYPEYSAHWLPRPESAVFSVVRPGWNV